MSVQLSYFLKYIFKSNYFSHSFIHYPIESQVSLGTERRGCFEPPSDTTEPNSGIVCYDIVPIESPANVTKSENMKYDSQILHPDSQNTNRYVMGTRLQTSGKKGKISHKLATCKFHNLDLSKQGAQVKTMSQGEIACILCLKYSRD